jgi:hypothetical protein
MLNTTETIELRPAQTKETVNAARIERVEIDFRKGKAEVLLSLGTKSGSDFVPGGAIRKLEVDFGAGQGDTVRAYLETALKKKLAEGAGFDDTKTTVE